MSDEISFFVYVCRNCGVRYNGGGTNPKNAVPYLAKIINGEAPEGNPLTLHDIHHCNADYAHPVYGVADLVAVLEKDHPWTPLVKPLQNQNG